MKKFINSFILFHVCTALLAQTFQILHVTPPRTFIVPNMVTGYVACVCVLTPSNAWYTIQVSTNMILWHDRTSFTANNGVTSCWNVSLQQVETNRFYVRAKLTSNN